MTRLRSTIGPVLMLAALAAIAVPVAASAASSKHREKEVVGRITAITSTGLTVGNTTFTASSRTLAGLATGQCVELKAEQRAGALLVTRIKTGDRCGRVTVTTGTTTRPTTTTTTSTTTVPVTTTGGADDPTNHDTADDNGRHGSDDAADHDAGDDDGQHGGGSDD